MKVLAVLYLSLITLKLASQCALITNGDFSQYGNPPSGFTSPDQTFNATYPNACMGWAEFAIGQTICPNPAGHWAGYTGDHTTGTGNALFVDITPWAPKAKIYVTSVNTTPGENYRFSYWGKNINGVVSGADPSVDLEVDNVIQNSPQVFSYSAGWQYKEYIFTASNTMSNLNLHHTFQHSGNGYDFALDDVCAEPVFDSIQVRLLNTYPALCIGDTAKFQFEYYGYNGSICFNVSTGGAPANMVFQNHQIYEVPITATTTFTFQSTFCNGKQFSKSYTILAGTQLPASISSTNICAGDTNDVQILGYPGGQFSLVPPIAGAASINSLNGEVYNYQANQSYIIQYQVSNNGCNGTGYDTLVVFNQEFASITVPDYCVNTNNQVIINGTAGGYFAFAPLPTDGATIQPLTGVISNGVAGSQYFIYYETPGTCWDDTIVSVSVLPQNDASFVFNDFCPGSIALPLITGDPGGLFSFDPIPTDGAAINASTGVISTNSDGVDYFVKYKVGACSDSLIVQVHVHDKPEAVLSGQGDLCDAISDSLEIQLSGNGPFDFSFTDGVTVYNYVGYNASNFYFPVNSLQTYNMVHVQDVLCPGDISGQAVFVSTGPDFSVDTSADCPGFTAHFTLLSMLQGAATCLWDFGDGQTYTGCQNAEHVFSTEGCQDITLTVNATQGCVGTTTSPSMVCVYPLPQADYTQEPNNPSFFNNQVYFYNSSLDASQVWWMIDGLMQSTDPYIQHEFSTDTSSHEEICLIAQSNHGCLDTLCKEFTIQEDYLVYVPNTFTPDENDLNEVFIPKVSGIETYDFFIRDRWGALVFQTNQINQGWNGRYKGVKLPQGVYTWQIELKNNQGKEHIKRGSVLMIY